MRSSTFTITLLLGIAAFAPQASGQGTREAMEPASQDSGAQDDYPGADSSDSEDSLEALWSQLDSQAPSEPKSADALRVSQAEEAQILKFCGDCHQPPNPNHFEKREWYDKALKGYEYYARSGRQDLDPPAFATVVRYFLERAPERIQFAPPPPLDREWSQKFLKTKLDWKDGDYLPPAIASIAWSTIAPSLKPQLIVTDMRDGSVNLIQPNIDPRLSARKSIARLASPARFLIKDVNEDGLDDLIVAELGSLNPFDHGFGKLILLTQIANGEFSRQTLVQGRGRIADVCEVDGSEDPAQILFAEFGHRSEGGIYKLDGLETLSQRAPTISRIDIRPGTVRLLPGNWDNDPHGDFMALVTQEYESIELFHGRPANRWTGFNRQTLFSESLTHGSVGLTEVDIDGDQDMDLLYTHGDCFDDNYAQVSHGLDLLLNQGGGNFEQQSLLSVPGAYATAAADFDGDQDLDIVLVTNLPSAVSPLSLSEQPEVATILLLEQQPNLQFKPHVLARGAARYSTVEAGDFNGDGSPDFVVGCQLLGQEGPTSAASQIPRLTIWWNKG